MFIIATEDDALFQEISQHAKRELGLDCRQVAAGQPADLMLAASDAPYRLRELLARMQATSSAPDEWSLGTLRFLPRVRRVETIDSAQGCDLTDKETQLLLALLPAGVGGVAKDELLKNIWGIEAELNTHTLETHIYRLRKKLKELSGSEIISATDNGYTVII